MKHITVMLMTIMLLTSISVVSTATADDESIIATDESTISTTITIPTNPEYTEYPEMTDVLIILDSTDIKGMLDTIKQLEEIGVNAIHRFPPNVIIGQIPANNIDALKQNIHIVTVSTAPTVSTSITSAETIDITQYVQYGTAAEIGAYIWNENYVNKSAETSVSSDDVIYIDGESMTVSEIMNKISESLINDIATLPTTTIPAVTTQDSSIQAPYGAEFYDTSEYMIGDIAIGIIFPESNGKIDKNIEDWPSTQRQIGNIQKALHWLATRDSRSKLTFTYDINLIPTSYEPVTRFYWLDAEPWVAEVMNNMGYNKYGWYDNVRDYDNTIRDRYKTDWSYTIFMVRSKTCQFCNPAGYAYPGGPYAVIRDGLDFWDIIPQIVAHETGHIFYATDEYNRKKEYSGYLNASDNDGSLCLMNGVLQPWFGLVCTSSGTRLQLGWRDSDNNNILDIIDFYLTMTMSKYPPRTNTDTLTYTGRCMATATYPNNNPYGSGNDITINKIKNIKYRIDNGPWIEIAPTDGLFDSSIEDFRFTTPKLTSGIHTIEVSTCNTVNKCIQDSNKVTIRGKQTIPYMIQIQAKAHVQDIGWTDWITNPDSDTNYIGTIGQSKRMEAVQIRLVNADTPPKMKICYTAYVQNTGWMNEVCDGDVAGTTGQALRMEAIKIRLVNTIPSMHVTYRGYVQDQGWMPWQKDGEQTGTTEQSLRMEALNIKLTTYNG